MKIEKLLADEMDKIHETHECLTFKAAGEKYITSKKMYCLPAQSRNTAGS